MLTLRQYVQRTPSANIVRVAKHHKPPLLTLPLAGTYDRILSSGLVTTFPLTSDLEAGQQPWLGYAVMCTVTLISCCLPAHPPPDPEGDGHHGLNVALGGSAL
eukprot:189160-Chlamydomonas_euryale.AAC.2